MKIVLLCGYKGCGKDTFAKHLVSTHGYSHMKISKPLKDSLKILFEFTDEQIEGNLKDVIDERWNITPRDAMIHVGTDMFQYKIQELIPGINRNFWIQTLCNKIINSKEENIVISDLRFYHELNHIIDLKHKKNDVEVTIVKIVRPSLKIYYNKSLHESETEHLKFQFDKFVSNTDDITDYHYQIDSIVT